MSIMKPDAAGSTLAAPRKHYIWEEEQTLVERRRRSLRHRLSRFIRSIFLPGLILSIVVAALLNEDVMRAIIPLLTTVFRFLFAATFIIIQFVALFWFVSRTRTYTIWPGTEGINFRDYRGHPEVLAQAKQIVQLLRGVKVFENAGGEPLNGLLLEGPPGTGKTWLGQAISTEAGVPFFYLDASSMQSMFVGVGPMKVGRLYGKARRAAKQYGAAVIFIDEIDAIGSRGGVAQVENTDQAPQSKRLNIMFGMGAGSGLLNTLLIEMSGFSLEHGWRARLRTRFYRTVLRRNPPKPQKRVLTIGATNRIQALDPALLRPGRFDKKLRIDAPDLEGRRDIIDYYLTKYAHDDTVDSLVLASETPYYTPADLKYLLNEALRYALFDNRTSISMHDIRRAQPEHEYGVRSPIHNLAQEDKYRLAAHESGHAIAIRLFMPKHRIARVTIIRQGGAHGYVRHYPATDEFEYISTYDSLMARLRVAAGGKAGEMEYCGEGSQTLGVGVGWGDSSDFGHIRAVLFLMANAGMFGQLGSGGDWNEANLTPEMRERMEETFRMVLEEVRLALRLNREMGEALIQLLLEKEELMANEIEAFFDKYGLFTPKVQLSRLLNAGAQDVA